jgi:HSP20 family protein
MAETIREKGTPQGAEPQRTTTSLQSGQEPSGKLGRLQPPSVFSVSPGEFFTMSPITLMRRLTEDIDRAFGRAPNAGQSSGDDEIGWMPRVEVSQSGNHLMVHAELPGVDEKDVRVEASEDGLSISGERKHEQETQEDGWQRSEFSYGRFYRLIPLPEGAKIDQAKADFRNGVLEVTMPVPESQSQRRQIPIGDSGQGKTSTPAASASSTQERAKTATGTAGR